MDSIGSHTHVQRQSGLQWRFWFDYRNALVSRIEVGFLYYTHFWPNKQKWVENIVEDVHGKALLQDWILRDDPIMFISVHFHANDFRIPIDLGLPSLIHLIYIIAALYVSLFSFQLDWHTQLDWLMRRKCKLISRKIS